MALASALTIEDFEKLPDALAVDHELVDGELVDVSGNVARHNRLRDLLVSLLLPFVEQHRLGGVVTEQEYDFDGNAHGPDVTFFGTEKVPLFDEERRVQLFVPDLAIEIVSKNDTFSKLMKKVNRYRRCGTKETWIFSVDTREAFGYAGQRRLFLGDDAEFSSDLIPGFSIRLGELFDRLTLSR